MTNKSIVLTAILGALATSVNATEFSWYDGKWPQETSDIAPMSNMHYGRLANGFRWVIVPHAHPKGRVSIYLNVQAGSLMEEPQELGVAHYLEHMAFNGSKNFPAGSLIPFFQSHGMSLGTDTNAHTNLGETVYKLNLSKNNPKFVHDGLRVLRDVADGLLLDPKEVEKERSIILNEQAVRANEEMMATLGWQKFLYGGTRLSRDVIGTTESLRSLSADQLQNFYKKWYVPSRMVLIVVGDVSSWQTLAKDIDTTYGSLVAKDPAVINSFGEVDRFGVRIFVQPRPITATYVSISILHAPVHKPDTKENRREQYVNMIAAVALQRRLLVKEEKQPTLWSNAQFINNTADPFMPTVTFIARTDGQHWRDALKGLNEELLRAQEYGLTEHEFKDIKNDISTLFKREVKESASWTNEDYARELVQRINSNVVFSDPKEDARLYESVKDDITLEEVNTVLRKLLLEKNRRLSISGDIKVDDVAVRQYWESIENMPVDPPQDLKHTAFPYLDIPTQIAHVPELSSQKLSIIGHQATLWSTTLPNGVKVLMLPANYEKQVMVEFMFGDGLAGLKDADSIVARAAMHVLGANGVGKLTPSDMDARFGANGLAVKESIEERYNSIMGVGTPDNAKLLLEAVWTQFMDPTLTPENQTRIAQIIKQHSFQRDKTVDGYVGTRRQAFFSGERIRMRPIDAGEVSGMPISRLRDYVNAVRDRGQRVLVITGDINKAKLYPWVTRLFGNLTSAVPGKKQWAPFAFPAGANRVVTLSEDKQDRAEYSLAWHVDMKRIEDRKLVMVRSAIALLLKERLRQTLREEKGVTYSPNVDYYFDTTDGFGFLQIDVATKIATLDEVKKGIDEIAESAHVHGFSQAEFQKVIKTMTTGLEAMPTHIALWHYLLTQETVTGHPEVKWMDAVPSIIKSITLADVNAEVKAMLSEPKASLTVKSGYEPPKPEEKADDKAVSTPAEAAAKAEGGQSTAKEKM